MHVCASVMVTSLHLSLVNYISPFHNLWDTLFSRAAGSNIVRVRTPGAGQIKVIGAGGQTTQILRPATATTTTQSGMTGIAALAAAAAATQKITTSTGAVSSPTAVKVVQPNALVTPPGLKVATTIAGQTVRLVAPSGQVCSSFM